jgi:flagellar biosynthesis protein FlhF
MNDIRTYRAATMQEALALVRLELGPSAAVLHTRQVRGSRLLRWIGVARQIEVTASSQVKVPSRLPQRTESAVAHRSAPLEWEGREIFRNELKGRLDQLQSLVEDLCRRSRHYPQREWTDSLFRLYADLIDAEIGDDLARELVERLRRELPDDDLGDTLLAKARIARWIEDEMHIAGPIVLTPGRRRLVALVGPTGVGKTTTIAKLAANFRLRDKRRVGLITVDTYRIAAVEQLRTYADIIELPMRVVSTVQEMRTAVDAMADLDLVLLDTAGRSPKDEEQLQELRRFVAEAGADEVHLVLSSVASANTLARTVERFAEVGTSALILTKLDEANALGNVLGLVRSCGLPLSYLTNGQNVPDDIAPADGRALARIVLGVDR